MVDAVSVAAAKRPAGIPAGTGGSEQKTQSKRNPVRVIFHGYLVGRRRAGAGYFGAVPAVSAVPGPAFGDLPSAARTWGLGVGMGLGT